MNTKNTLNNELEKLICEFIELIKKYENFTGNKYENLVSNEYKGKKVVEILKNFTTDLSEQKIEIDTAMKETILEMLATLAQKLLEEVEKYVEKYTVSDDIKESFKNLSFYAEIAEYHTRISTKLINISMAKLELKKKDFYKTKKHFNGKVRIKKK